MVLLSDLDIIVIIIYVNYYYGASKLSRKCRTSLIFWGHSVVGPLYITCKGPELVDLNVFLLIVSWLGPLTRQDKKEKKIE